MSKMTRYLEMLASAVGITGLLYAIGFLAVRAHLRMLGISELPIEKERYLEMGGHFIWKSMVSLTFVPFMVLEFIIDNWWVLLLPLLLAGVLLVANKTGQRKIAQLRQLPARRKEDFTFLAVVSFGLLVLLLAVTSTLPGFLDAPAISQLLHKYDSATQANGQQDDGLEGNIIRGRGEKLGQYYAKLELFLIILTISVLTVRKGCSGLSHRTGYYLACRGILYLMALVVGIHFVFLPLNYGILLSSNRYSEVLVTFNDNERTAKGLLLGQDSQTVGLYALERRQFIVFQKSLVASILFKGERSLFSTEGMR